MSENTPQTNWTLQNDLDEILAATHTLWPELDGGHVFITGGTGFIGCWWLETLRHVNRTGTARIHATILSRDPQAFQKRYPHLADEPCFHFMQGSVDDFAMPDTRFTHIIHAATEASNRYQANPAGLFDTVITGTRRVLELARACGHPRLLNLSSGAIYGNLSNVERVTEDWQGGPDCRDPRAAYAEAKRCAEMLCAVYGGHYQIPIVTARIFTLIGPYMPLDEQFAAGNFLRDALAGKPVIVQGDGTAQRSYLYAADLIIWLITLLVRGESGQAYNVGSQTNVSIAELAEQIAVMSGSAGFVIRGIPVPDAPVSRYLPDTRLIREALGVEESVPLQEGIRRAAAWIRAEAMHALSPNKE